jgi:hypothetical protein
MGEDQAMLVTLRRVARRDEEGEDAHDRGAEFTCDPGDPAHPFQLRAERRPDRDLPDGRADRRDPHSSVLKCAAEHGDLPGGEVGDVDRPRAAQLEVPDRLGGERRELLFRVRGDLVREPAEDDGHEPTDTGRPSREDS